MKAHFRSFTFPFELPSPEGLEVVLVEAVVSTRLEFSPRAGHTVPVREAEIGVARFEDSGVKVELTPEMRTEMEHAALAWEVR